MAEGAAGAVDLVLTRLTAYLQGGFGEAVAACQTVGASRKAPGARQRRYGEVGVDEFQGDESLAARLRTAART